MDGFDEEIEDEIEQIWQECQVELEKEADKRREVLENLYEAESNEKYERLAEMKAEYNIMIKNCDDEELKERMVTERNHKLEILKKDLDMKRSIKNRELKK